MNCAGNPGFAKNILVIGLPSSGKTTLVHKMKGLIPDPIPTIGLKKHIVNSVHGHKVTLFDIGGTEFLQYEWQSLFREVEGLIFVVDVKSPRHVSESNARLVETLAHRDVEGKPVLIVANRTDVNEPLSEDRLFAMFDLDYLLFRFKSHVRLAFNEDHTSDSGNPSDTGSCVSVKIRQTSSNDMDQRSRDRSTLDQSTRLRHALNEPSDNAISTATSKEIGANEAENVGNEDVNKGDYVELMNLEEGCSWFLQFIDDHREDLEIRTTEGRRRNSSDKSAHRLEKIERLWEKFAKDKLKDLETYPGTDDERLRHNQALMRKDSAEMFLANIGKQSNVSEKSKPFLKESHEYSTVELDEGDETRSRRRRCVFSEKVDYIPTSSASSVLPRNTDDTGDDDHFPRFFAKSPDPKDG